MPALRSHGSESHPPSPYRSPVVDNGITAPSPVKEDNFSWPDNDEHGWQHPAELPFLMPDWTITEIIDFIVMKGLFSVPARSQQSNVGFFTVTSEDAGGSVTATSLPIRYRVPLLWTARFLWLSLELILDGPPEEVDDFKYGILHLARLLSGFLEKARLYDEALGLERRWRDETFDRALVRFRAQWLIQTPEKTKSFYQMHGKDEYMKDVLGGDWKRWAMKGVAGFKLTEEEILDGISQKAYLRGLRFADKAYLWDKSATEEESETSVMSHLRTVTSADTMVAQLSQLPPIYDTSAPLPTGPTPLPHHYFAAMPTMSFPYYPPNPSSATPPGMAPFNAPLMAPTPDHFMEGAYDNVNGNVNGHIQNGGNGNESMSISPTTPLQEHNAESVSNALSWVHSRVISRPDGTPLIPQGVPTPPQAYNYYLVPSNLQQAQQQAHEQAQRLQQHQQHLMQQVSANSSPAPQTLTANGSANGSSSLGYIPTSMKDEPGAVIIHPPFHFPGYDPQLHPEGLTFSLMVDHPDWYLDPDDYVNLTDDENNTTKMLYPLVLSPPWGWGPPRGKVKKEKDEETVPESSSPERKKDSGETAPRLRCTFCKRSYAGVNAKSMWRRHVFEKHKIAMSNRREGGLGRLSSLLDKTSAESDAGPSSAPQSKFIRPNAPPILSESRTLEDVIMASPATPWQPTSKFPVSAFPAGSGVTPYSNRPIPVAGTSSAGTVAPIKTRTAAVTSEGPRQSPRNGGRKTNNSLSTDNQIGQSVSSSATHALASSSTLPDFSQYEGLATSASTGPLIKTLLSSFAILTDEIAALRGEVRALRQGEAGSLGSGIFKDSPPSLDAWKSNEGLNGDRSLGTASSGTLIDQSMNNGSGGPSTWKGKQKATDEERLMTPTRGQSLDGSVDVDAEKTFHRPSILHPTISKSPTLEKSNARMPPKSPALPLPPPPPARVEEDGDADADADGDDDDDMDLGE